MLNTNILITANKYRKFESFFGHETIKMEYPRIATYWITERQPKLSFFVVMLNFEHKHVINDFEPRPDFLDGLCGNVHGIFFIELFIGEDTIFVNDNEPLLPFAQDL